MISIKTTFLAMCLALMGCSNVLSGALLGSGGLSTDPGKTGEEAVRFHPSEKPARPASYASVQKIFNDLKVTSRYVPDDAAFMKSIIVGDKVREIYRGSYDQTRAIEKLFPEGRTFLNRITQNCTLSPANRIDNGKPKPGSAVSSKLNMISDGLYCDYRLKKSVTKTVTYTHPTTDQGKGIYRWSENHSVAMEEKRELLDGEIQKLANLKSLTFSNQITGAVNYSASREGYKITALLKGAGKAQVVFTDGEILQGLVHSETITDDDRTVVNVRFDGKTSKGDILIMALRDAKGVLSVYVNGSPASPEVLDAFGLNLMESASRRY